MENGGFSIVPHLVSVICEVLSKRAQPRPRLVARGTWHAIFSCECGKSAGLTAGRKENSEDRCGAQKSFYRTARNPIHPTTTPDIHTASSITFGETLSRQRECIAFSLGEGYLERVLQAKQIAGAPTAPTPTFGRFAPHQLPKTAHCFSFKTATRHLQPSHPSQS